MIVQYNEQVDNINNNKYKVDHRQLVAYTSWLQSQILLQFLHRRHIMSVVYGKLAIVQFSFAAKETQQPQQQQQQHNINCCHQTMLLVTKDLCTKHQGMAFFVPYRIG
jgi:hypothetical protein